MPQVPPSSLSHSGLPLSLKELPSSPQLPDTPDKMADKHPSEGHAPPLHMAAKARIVQPPAKRGTLKRAAVKKAVKRVIAKRPVACR